MGWNKGHAKSMGSSMGLGKPYTITQLKASRGFGVCILPTM